MDVSLCLTCRFCLAISTNTSLRCAAVAAQIEIIHHCDRSSRLYFLLY
ncbi:MULTISPECIES: hypothetical protein [unclassified Microcoleus]|nr:MULTISPECIES: hypothetical protein [unclassified Microcoleus]